MSTWILILSLTYFRTGAIDHIPGFKTQEACMVAGNAWMKQQSQQQSLTPHALCVEQK